MAKGEAVDDTPFDPSSIAGDKPSKRRRRAAATTRESSPEDGEKPAGADPALDPDIADDADAHAHPEEFETRPPDIVEVEWQLAKECADFDQNDSGNGQRLIVWFGANLCYVSGMGWLTWRGTHWQRDEGELDARRLAQLLVDKIKLEAFHIEPTTQQAKVLAAAEALKDKPEEELSAAQKGLIGRAEKIRTQLGQKRGKRRNFAVSSGNSGRTASMLIQAASFKAIDQKLLDADLYKFNVRNGTLKFARVPDPEQDLEGDDVKPRFIGEVTISDARSRRHADQDRRGRLRARGRVSAVSPVP
jgi:putative DNA primase/helicase